jgi:hypothetical protein
MQATLDDFSNTICYYGKLTTLLCSATRSSQQGLEPGVEWLPGTLSLTEPPSEAAKASPHTQIKTH